MTSKLLTAAAPLLLAVAFARQAPPPVSAVDEFVGPFASWADVKTRHHALGDGVADDSAAIQGALDQLGPDNHSTIVFIPAGTYRITRTLSLNDQLGMGIIGEDPERTRLVWDGAAGGTMLAVRGTAYSRIDRLTFDGRGRASIAIEQASDGKKGNFDTGNEYADDRFIDVEYGIHGGFEDHGFAETSIVRARFIRNSVAGVALGNFNALDIWVWHSLFEDCGSGITNNPGAGNYRVYNSVFRRSKVADLVMQNTGGFTARNNYSVGSGAFWISDTPINHPATIDIQGNTIIDPVNQPAIRLANQGPGLIMDNAVRSLPNTTGPIVSWWSFYGSDVISIGNTFTVPRAVYANGRMVTIDDRVVGPDAISAKEPALPQALPDLRRHVFEVPAGAGAGVIQQAIDNASRAGGVRPVVHVPFGHYAIDRMLKIPADVQLVGDGMRTVLKWSGAGQGPVIALQTPTRATLRELVIDGAGTADGIAAAGLDRAGSRVYFEGVQMNNGTQSNLLVDTTGKAAVQLVDIGHAGGLGTSVIVRGAGETVIYSGASSNNKLSYDVSAGATLIARDIWYEGSAENGFARVRDKGIFTLQGARVATPEGRTPPAFTIDTDAERVTLLTTLFDDRIVVVGSAGRADILGVANLREASERPALANTGASPARALMLHLRQRVAPSGMIPRGTVPVPDVGMMDAAFVRDMLLDTRRLPPPSLAPVPAGASDLRLFRVWVNNGVNNVVLAGAQR